MKMYCETVAQVVLPTIRALVAKELMEKYNFTQQGVASKLGLTQSAVSQYMRNLRGSKIKILESDKKISRQIEKFAGRIASGELDSSDNLVHFCNICKNIRKRNIL
jgi:predicted transcriptional regulator